MQEPIFYGVTGGVLALFLRHLLLSFTPKSVARDDRTGEQVMYFGIEFKIAALLFLILVLLLVVTFNLVLEPEHPYDRPLVNVLLVVGLAEVVFQLVDAFSRRVTIRDEGLCTKVAWFQERCLQWSEIREVSYSTFRTSFIVYGGRGRSLRVSSHLRGVANFHQALCTHLPHEALQRARRGFNLAGIRSSC